jgi:hypothetical protein
MESCGLSQWRLRGSEWSPVGSTEQWSQILITLLSSRIRIRIKVTSWILIHIKVVRICNSANDPDNCNVLLGALKGLQSRPVVAYSHHFDKEKDADSYIKVRSWIRIHIKVKRIRNPDKCNVLFSGYAIFFKIRITF